MVGKKRGMAWIFWVVAGMFASVAHAADKTILVLGDSLSAAYGLRADQGWPSLLETRLRDNTFNPGASRYRVINASVSGETSAGGLSRAPALLARHKPAVLILALGANDGLRGLPLAQMRDNLDDIARQARKAGARVLIAGMRMPPNFGPRYTREFQATFGELARARKAAYVPFLLEGFAGDPAMFQADGLHPTAAAQPRILQTVWPALKPLL